MSEITEAPEVESMSLEDLDKSLLSGTPKPEVETTTVVETEVKPEVTTQTKPEDVKTTDVKQEESTDSGFVFDDTKLKADGWNDAQIEVLRKSEEKSFNKQKMIERQAQEVGETRKKEAELIAKQQELSTQLAQITQDKDQLKEHLYENPQAYEKAVLGEAKLKQDLQAIESQKAAIATQKYIYDRIPEFQNLIATEIPNVVREEAQKAGYTEAQTNALINGFKDGSWSTFDPKDLLIIGERAKSRYEIAQYKFKIEALSKTPDSVGKKVAAIANQRPTVTGTTDVDVDDVDVDSLSLAELNKRLGIM